MAIDGKKVDATPLQLVSAFAAGAGLALGQIAAAQSNEKTAIPLLLQTLALEGTALGRSIRSRFAG